MTIQHDVTCADCGAKMVLRVATKARGEMKGKPFYGCSSYPKCKATHGAHPDGAPMGVPGNAATKAARIRAHAAFDVLWKGAGAVMKRGPAYVWLDDVLGLGRGKAHIGNFDEVTCDQVVAAVAEQLPLLHQRAEVRRALDVRFGGHRNAVVVGRRWLAVVLGRGEHLFVSDLDAGECARALAAISAPPPAPHDVALEVLGAWRIIEIGFRFLAAITTDPTNWAFACNKHGRPDLIPQAEEVRWGALGMVALARLFIGPDQDADG